MSNTVEILERAKSRKVLERVATMQLFESVYES